MSVDTSLDFRGVNASAALMVASVDLRPRNGLGSANDPETQGSIGGHFDASLNIDALTISPSRGKCIARNGQWTLVSAVKIAARNKGAVE